MRLALRVMGMFVILFLLYNIGIWTIMLLLGDVFSSLTRILHLL